MQAALTIGRREFRALLRSPSLLVALGLGLAAASVAVHNVLGEVAREGLATRASPLYFPLFAAVLVLSFALAIVSTTSVAREREAGTLEVLFYGPIDAATYVLGIYAGQVAAYLALCPLLVVAFVAYSWLTNLAFSVDLLPGILLSALAAAGSAAFGLFLSAFCASVRAALLVLVGASSLFLAVQGGSWLLASLPERSGALAIVAATLAGANRVAALVSPYSYLDRGMEAALLGDGGTYGIAVASSVLYAVSLIGGTVWALRWRGVRQTALLLAFFVAGPSSFALAQAPARERHLVYGIHAFNGLGYSAAFAPPTADTIYLMADVDSAVSPRRTEIYWWPLTNRYEPDWNALNEPVAGSLEVWRAFQRLDAVQPTSYVVQFPDGPTGPAELHTGEGAAAKYTEFEERRRAYRDALWDYHQQNTEHRQRLDEAAERVARGEVKAGEESLPVAPREPAPLRIFSTGVNQGYVLNLPVGRYRLRVVGQDGRVVPESERNLVVFAPRREGLSYAIYPETRWTRPHEAGDPNAVVYTASGGVFYFQPFRSLEVNDRFFSRLEDPQSQSVEEDTWRWVRILPHDGGRLEMTASGIQSSIVEQKRYQVQQSAGGGLGYQILELSAEAVGRTPDLDAFRVDVEPGRRYGIRLLDPEARSLAGDVREIRPVAAPNGWSLAAVPVVPFALAIALAARRRMTG